MPRALGKTLLIVNPTAQNGQGIKDAHYAEGVLRQHLPEETLDVVMTEAPLHGIALAEKSCAYDTVIALGGDGLIHEIANGLMKIPATKRPVFGVLPAGSGNDYARSLNMSFSIEESVTQLLAAQIKTFDVGLCNGEYFVETLSFGLDAAIALDTVERRQRTGKTGTALFLESGIDILLHHMHDFPYVVSYDDGEIHQGEMLLFAVQIGKTYGGGFTICPEASPYDGLLDICIAHPPLGIPKAVMIFLLAKNAHHTRFKQLEFTTAKKLTICFVGKKPLMQIDGEPLQATKLEISCVPQALKVLVSS